MHLFEAKVPTWRCPTPAINKSFLTTVSLEPTTQYLLLARVCAILHGIGAESPHFLGTIGAAGAVGGEGAGGGPSQASRRRRREATCRSLGSLGSSVGLQCTKFPLRLGPPSRPGGMYLQYVAGTVPLYRRKFLSCYNNWSTFGRPLSSRLIVH